jgi:hypothetical protein
VAFDRFVFFLWGVDYPFQFLLTATFMLVIWGAVGGAFGLQGLFLDEDPLTQVLLGGTVMLLFAAVFVHYVAIGSSRRGWWVSLHGLAGVLRGLTSLSAAPRPVQAALANGFLERLSATDIDAIDAMARREVAAAGPPFTPLDLELRAALESEPFRLLLAPAIFLVKGFVLVILLGIVPALVIPLLDGDAPAVFERLPWLVGVCLGDAVGVVLCCWTTAWLARAAGWSQRQEAILATLHRWESQADRAATADAIHGLGPWQARSAAVPLWLTLLTWFFLVHAGVNLLLPRTITARWIEFPERNLAVARHGDSLGPASLAANFPWLPLLVFTLEVGVAVLLAAAWRRMSGTRIVQKVSRRSRVIMASALEGLLYLLRVRWLHRLAVVAAGLIAVAAVVVTLVLRPEATHSAWIGLRGYASLGSILLGWIGIFWLATHAAVGGGARTPLEQQAAMIGLGLLATLHGLGAPPPVVAPLAATAAVVSGSRTLASLRSELPPVWHRAGWAIMLTVVASVSLVVAWQTGVRLARQGFSERLATVYFTVGPLERRNDGSHVVVLDVEDPLGRLRAVAGDVVRLAAEEWFTIRPDGGDLIALAEEPFYRRIHRLFGYETIHMIRNGIIRGLRRRLVLLGDDTEASERWTRYSFLSPGELDLHHSTPDRGSDPMPSPKGVLGLRLEGLAAEYRALQAEYALIAMHWRGDVVSVRHQPDADVYRVEFTLPVGFPPLDAGQLRTMQSWMERCHLDTLRPAVAALPRRQADASPPARRAGDCLVLEDARTDAAVPVGVFLVGPPDLEAHDSAFAAHWLSPEAIRRTLATIPSSVASPVEGNRSTVDPAPGFTLRPAHDRGLFACPDAVLRRFETGAGVEPRSEPVEALKVALYNAGRLRRGDRLILSWNGQHDTASGAELARAVVCAVEAVGVPTGEAPDLGRPLPPGAVWVRLVPVDRRAGATGHPKGRLRSKHS